ncbi:metal ABC transporter substrate-binding protein [Streptomyces sp. NPDC060048]|uniref:metal ABC transporter substrate-binding protein n=1 Tax=unclassified Streptomyces TaxID=2593676 RepID=UPI003693DDA0
MNRIRTRYVLGALVAVLASAASLTACGAGGSTQSSTLNVVTGFYPLTFITERVGGDAVRVTDLTSPGVEAHDLDLSPQQTSMLGSADLVVYAETMAPVVDKAVATTEPKRTLEAGAVAGLRHTDSKDYGKVPDPHFWLDPLRVAKVAEAIGEELAKAQPEHAEAHRERARRLCEQLTALDGEFRAGLASCARKDVVTSHAAFGYLASRYELNQIAISGVSPQAEASPARIRQIQQAIKDKEITTVFFETLATPKMAETLATDLGLKAAVLDPVEGLAPGSGKDYLSLMRDNLAALRTALDCR